MTDGKPIIEYDDFAKLDLRVARILEASEHPNADRLLVLTVDLGDEQRQIIAGIKGYYDPQELLGKQIIIVANLAPRKMRGLESQGMLLAAVAGGEQVQDVILICPDKDVPPGTAVS